MKPRESVLKTAAENTMKAAAPEHSKVWILVFMFSFLGLMVDGADLMLLSYSLTGIKAEFGLTNVEAGSLGSITLAGMAIGGIYGGWTCDRFGRVKTVSWTIVVFSAGTAVLGLTHSYLQFAAARFVASLGRGALYVACNTLMAEYVPTKYRTTVLGTLQAGLYRRDASCWLVVADLRLAVSFLRGYHSGHSRADHA
jgi:MFS transporter, AAHS family, cis,cis-muconate transporter